jgi:hypothetical protein
MTKEQIRAEVMKIKLEINANYSRSIEDYTKLIDRLHELRMMNPVD